MDDNTYSATKGKFSHLNKIEYSKNDLFKKFIQYLKDEKYGYTNLTFQHFQEITRLRFEKREIAVEIAESLSKIKRTLSRESIKKIISFVKNSRGSLNKELTHEKIIKFIENADGLFTYDDVQVMSKYISHRNIFESLIEWKEMEAEELILIQSNSRYNIYHTKTNSKKDIYLFKGFLLFRLSSFFEYLRKRNWDITKNMDQDRYNQEQLGLILEKMEKYGYKDKEVKINDDANAKLSFKNEEPDGKIKTRFNIPSLYKFKINFPKFSDDQIVDDFNRVYENSFRIGENSVKEVVANLEREDSVLKDILAGDHASGSRTNLSNDQIFRFLENINNAKLSFRQMARDILEDQGEDVNFKSEDAILNKLKRIRDRLKNNEIKNNLNAAIRAGQIKTTKGKVMQKQYTYKFLTGPEKAQLINKAKNN